MSSKRSAFIHRTEFFRGADVVIVGQGPSSWTTERVHLPINALMVVCNERRRDPLLLRSIDLVAAADARMAYSILEDPGSLESYALPKEHVREWLSRGNTLHPWFSAPGVNLFALSKIDGGSSTGATVLQAALWGSARRVVLIGFDGHCDTRNLYAGRPGYESAPSAATFLRWGAQMRALVAAEGDRRKGFSVHVVVTNDEPTPFDGVARFAVHKVREGEAWDTVRGLVSKKSPVGQCSPADPPP